MQENNRQERAKQALQQIAESRDVLAKEAYERSASGTFTKVFGEKMEAELARLNTELGEFRKVFAPSIERVSAQLSGKLLTAAEYRVFMPNLQIELKPEAPLPFNILEILNSQSSLHEKGVLVKNSHLLAWIPDNLSLRNLSEALGGKKGKVLDSDWFIEDNNKLSDVTLSSCGQSGHWALIPDWFPKGTENKGFDASALALSENYPEYSQADGISFSAALLLNAVKNGERWYPDTYAWCKDPRVGTAIEDDSCFGGGRSPALIVGSFDANGLDVDDCHPDVADSSLGCAAFWNFGN